MAIKFAYSTVACPDWNLEKVAEQAKAMGYDGVELRTLGPGGAGLASDPTLTQPEKIRKIFANQGVAVVCLSTSASLHHRDATPAHRAATDIARAMEAAAAMGAPAVRAFAYEVVPGENRRSVLARVAEHTKPLAEKAGDLGVQLLFENAGSFCAAKEWWWLLDIINHPMVGLSWNLANGASTDPNDRGGWVSVPTLNSRIRLAKIKDAKLGRAEGFVPLGQGDLGAETFLKRLRGVGYDGYVSFEWDRLWLPTLAPAEEALPAALKQMKDWMAVMDAAQTEGRASKDKSIAKAQKEVDKAMAAAAKKVAAPAVA